jgi:deoxyribodipyrimidine photo-lyase
LEIAAGETAALRRWKRFVNDGLDDYAEHRDRPDLDGTSRLSAHLKFGSVDHGRERAEALRRYAEIG